MKSLFLLTSAFMMAVLNGCNQESPFTKASVTINYGSVTFEGKNYRTVFINGEEWLAENLRITKFGGMDEGDDILEINDSTSWATNIDVKIPAYCSLFFESSKADTFGYLYNWYAISRTDFAPEGWRVPNNDDWESLINYASSISLPPQDDPNHHYACSNLKDSYESWGWEWGTDSLGFKIIPNRFISHLGTSDYNRVCSCIYSIDSTNDQRAWHYHICQHFQFDNLHPCDPTIAGKSMDRIADDKNAGYAVRLIKKK